MRKNLLILMTLLLALTLLPVLSSAKATEWVEVARRSGSAFPDPEEFSMEFECRHVEWRIRWSYEAVGSPFESLLIIQKEGDPIVISMGYYSKSGVRNIHNEAGNFSLGITCANIYEYTIIVEQDVDSIPEFTIAALIIGLIAISLLVAALSKREAKRRNMERR